MRSEQEVRDAMIDLVEGTVSRPDAILVAMVARAVMAWVVNRPVTPAEEKSVAVVDELLAACRTAVAQEDAA